MRLVADDKLEISRREIREKPVVRGEALDRRHHDLRLRPILPLLFIDDRRDAVGREVGRKILLRLPLQLQSVHEEEDAVGVFRAQVEFRDGCAEERLARARRHFEEKAMLARQRRLLERADGRKLVVAQQSDFLVHHRGRALGRRVGRPGRVLRNGDVIFIHCDRREPRGVGPPLRRLAQFFQR